MGPRRAAFPLTLYCVTVPRYVTSGNKLRARLLRQLPSGNPVWRPVSRCKQRLWSLSALAVRQAWLFEPVWPGADLSLHLRLLLASPPRPAMRCRLAAGVCGVRREVRAAPFRGADMQQCLSAGSLPSAAGCYVTAAHLISGRQKAVTATGQGAAMASCTVSRRTDRWCIDAVNGTLTAPLFLL